MSSLSSYSLSLLLLFLHSIIVGLKYFGGKLSFIFSLDEAFFRFLSRHILLTFFFERCVQYQFFRTRMLGIYDGFTLCAPSMDSIPSVSIYHFTLLSAFFHIHICHIREIENTHTHTLVGNMIRDSTVYLSQWICFSRIHLHADAG